MINVKFTRDEVILALDVLFFSKGLHLTKNDPSIIELCELLQCLPIHPKEFHSANFRNALGVSEQLSKFRTEQKGIEHKTWKVGSIFHEVADEYQSNLDELHSVAESIKRNSQYFSKYYSPYQITEEFREGQLLSWLHQRIEQREQKKQVVSGRCRICHIALEEIYHNGDQLLQKHLLVPPAKLDANKQYSSNQFIVVCPNCHAALHQKRPWLSLDHIDSIIC